MAQKTSIDLQVVFNHYKPAPYMYGYLLKSEDECSYAMKVAL